jgi:hypothetical protein
MNVPHGQGRHFAAALISACGAGEAEFLAQWARRDADGFAKCLRNMFIGRLIVDKHVVQIYHAELDKIRGQNSIHHRLESCWGVT